MACPAWSLRRSAGQASCCSMLLHTRVTVPLEWLKTGNGGRVLGGIALAVVELQCTCGRAAVVGRGVDDRAERKTAEIGFGLLQRVVELVQRARPPASVENVFDDLHL